MSRTSGSGSVNHLVLVMQPHQPPLVLTQLLRLYREDLLVPLQVLPRLRQLLPCGFATSILPRHNFGYVNMFLQLTMVLLNFYSVIIAQCSLFNFFSKTG